MNEETFINYKVNILKFDRTHWNIFLHLKILANTTNSTIAIDIIDSLVDEWVQHIHQEEAFMASIDFPNLTEHASHHLLILAQFNKLKHEIYANRLDIAEQVHILEECLKLHITKWDKPYGVRPV